MIIPRTIIQDIDSPQKTLPEEREYINLLNDRIRSITLNYGKLINNGKTIIEKLEPTKIDGNIYPINSTEFYDGEIYTIENDNFHCCYFVKYSNVDNKYYSVTGGNNITDERKYGKACGKNPEKHRKPISERFEVYYKEIIVNTDASNWRLVYIVHVINKKPIIYQCLPNGGWRDKLSHMYR